MVKRQNPLSNQQLRIALIIPTFPPTVGGLETLSYLIARGLAERGNEVTVFTLSSGLLTKNDEFSGLNPNFQVRRYGKKAFHKKIKAYLCLFRDFMIEKSDVYYLISYVPSYLLFSAIAAGKLRRIPLVFQPIFQPDRLRTQKQKPGKMSGFFDFALGPALMIKPVYRLIALTAHEASFYERFVPKRKVVVIPELVDRAHLLQSSLDVQSQIRQLLGLNGDEKIILSVGRVVWNKGFDTLIEATSAILDQHKDVKVVIAGPLTEHVAFLKRLVNEKKLEEVVIFTGNLSEPHLAGLYDISTLVVCASRYEAFFRIPLETWTKKKAVVCSDHPVSRELIQDGKDGLLFKIGDSSFLAKQINYLLENESVRNRLGLAGYEKMLANYTENTIIQRINDVHIACK